MKSEASIAEIVALSRRGAARLQSVALGGSGDQNEHGRSAVALAVALALGVFAVDLISPRGVADGIGYIALVLLSLWMPWPRAPWIAASAATALTVAGYALSSPSVHEWIVWTNRLLTISAVWITAVVMHVYRNAQRRLHDDEMQLRAISETSPDAILIASSDGVIERANRVCLRLFGYADDTLIGRSVDMLLETDQTDIQRPPLSAALKAGAIPVGQVIERLARRSDGSVLPVQLSIGEASLLDRPVFTVFIRDVTQGRASEQKIQELQAQLSRMARRSELGGMASAIAHELNQPLSAIRTYVAVAQRAQRSAQSEAPVDVDEVLGKAMRQVDSAAEVIRHIQRLLSHGDVERSVEDLNATIREASTFALIGTQGMGIEVSTELAPGPLPCLINRVQIQQVMINLIRNSVDAMAGRERCRLAIRTRRAAGDQIEVDVADTGPGLAKSVQEKLFMPFVTTKPNGIGIGLSIAHSIIEAHGGSISATSNPEAGTLFRFRLPTMPGVAA